jgi:hypothetical protein
MYAMLIALRTEALAVEAIEASPLPAQQQHRLAAFTAWPRLRASRRPVK